VGGVSSVSSGREELNDVVASEEIQSLSLWTLSLSGPFLHFHFGHFHF
jgi:hypothetical protein